MNHSQFIAAYRMLEGLEQSLRHTTDERQRQDIMSEMEELREALDHYAVDSYRRPLDWSIET